MQDRQGYQWPLATMAKSEVLCLRIPVVSIASGQSDVLHSCPACKASHWHLVGLFENRILDKTLA